MSDPRDRWRRDLDSVDPIKVINAIPLVGASGDPEMLSSLEHAGAKLPEAFWDMTVALPDGEITAREFHQRSVNTLKASLPYAAAREAGGAPIQVMVSYTTADRERANRLAFSLSGQPGIEVFIDHWALATGDRLGERLERAIEEGAAVIVLLSPRSASARWVRQEIEMAVTRARADARFRLVPVLIEDCDLPETLADSVQIDWRDPARFEYVVQSVVEAITERRTFSQRVRDYVRGDPDSPYDEVPAREGRHLLSRLAAFPQLAVDSRQQGLLWELFHRLVGRYTCTVKLTRAEENGGVRCELVDRWNGTSHVMTLSPESFARGLWRFWLDLAESGHRSEDDADFLGRTGRLTFNRRSRVELNPAPETTVAEAREVLELVLEEGSVVEESSRQSMLFDLQRLVAPSSWHTVEVVLGEIDELNLAYSEMLRDPPPAGQGPCAVFELWDPFFGSLKYTAVSESLLPAIWECDVDLLSGEQEHYLGLA